MPHSTASRRAAIRRNQNRLLYEGIAFSFVGSAAATIVVLVSFAPLAGGHGAWIWYALVNVVYAARLIDYGLYRRSGTRNSHPGRWAIRFDVGTLLAACAWASSLWMILPEGDRPYQVLLILTLGGVSGGALASLSYDRHLNFTFQLVIFVAIEIRLLQAGDPFSREVALYCLFVFGFMIACGAKVGRHYLELLRLKQDAQESNLTLIKTTERMARTGYWQWDGASSTVELSENLALMWKFEHREVAIGACFRRLSREDRRRVRRTLEAVFRRGEEATVEHGVRALGEGTARAMRQVIKPLADSAERTRWLGTVQDVSDIRTAEQTIYRMAYRDELTGLANRASFHERLRETLEESERRGRICSLVYIDLDDFKGVNDSYGHECGDDYLRAFATHLDAIVRAPDLVARLGGDEFCVLLQDVGGEEGARAVAGRILEFSARPVEVGRHRIHPRLSIGISLFPRDGHAPDAMVRSADLAMYEVKRRGKHGYAFHDPAMRADSLETARLESDLRAALAGEQFELWYQPQIDLAADRISGVEALIRWRHPERGLVFPDRFIDVAERLGMIDKIGEWVIRTACAQLADWKREGHRLQMAVNVSGSHFVAEGFCSFVRDAARAAALVAGEFEVEITESVSRDPEAHARICRELREAGIRVSIDDFGTGYSSLSVLQNLEADVLKIDRSFVGGLPDDRPAMLLVTAITRMSQGLGFDLVAEGVETVEQLDVLRSLGCSHVQGYLFSRPVPADVVPGLIASGSASALAA